MPERTLVIMLKEPNPGRVKTRLGRDMGMNRAAWWFRHQSTRLIRRLGRDRRWNTLLAVSPDIGGLTSRVWPLDLARIPQGSGDLGHRMHRIFRTLPPGPVVIIGADIPGIRRQHIVRAFDALGDHDAVIGPADDGGYWLIGMKRVRAVPPGLFSGVRWSTANARADTIRSLGDHKVAQIDRLRDVDTCADLAAVDSE